MKRKKEKRREEKRNLGPNNTVNSPVLYFFFSSMPNPLQKNQHLMNKDWTSAASPLARRLDRELGLKGPRQRN